MTATRTAGTILVICTGNVCRSPYLERRLRAALGGSGVLVVSAGTGALVGQPMVAEGRQALAALDIPADDFSARQLRPVDVASADLIITATRDHRSVVARMEPRAMSRTFALADLSDLLTGLAADDQAQADSVAGVARVAALRRSEVAARSRSDADIIDPYRRGAAVYRQMIEQIDPLLPPIVQTLRRAGGGLP